MNWVEIEREISKWKQAPNFKKQSLLEYRKDRQTLLTSFKDLEKYYAEQNIKESNIEEFSHVLKAASICQTRSLIFCPEICRMIASCLISQYNIEEKATSFDVDLGSSSNFWCLSDIRHLLKPRNSIIVDSLSIAQDCGLSSFEIDELLICESIDTLVAFIDDTLQLFPQFPPELFPILCIDCIRLSTSPHSIRLVEKVLGLCTGFHQNNVSEEEDISSASKQDFMEALIKEIIYVNQFVYDGLDLSTRKNLCLFSPLVLEHELMSVLDSILFGRYLKPSDIRDTIKRSLIYRVVLDNSDMGIQAFDFLVKLVEETSDWRVVRAFIGWNQCLFEDSSTEQLPKFYPEYLAQLIGVLCHPPNSPRSYGDFLSLRDQILNSEIVETSVSKAHCVWLLSLTPLCWREKVYSWIVNIEQYTSLFLLEEPLTFCSWLSHPSDQPTDDLTNLSGHRFAEILRSHLPFSKTSIDSLVISLEKSFNANSRTFVTIEQMLKIASDTDRLDIMPKLFDTCGIHSTQEKICDMSTCTIILDFWNEIRSNSCSIVLAEHPIIIELTEMYNTILC